jgi:hypothetical protein
VDWENPATGQRGLFQGIFEESAQLVRVLVASEVLGPPVALRPLEASVWNQRPNEPST